MIEMKAIGLIHTPFNDIEDMPIQPAGAVGIKGTVEIFDQYRQGLDDIDGFSHIILLFHFHKSHGYNLHVVPFMDTAERGVFATRAPKRPNQIGFSVVKLNSIENNILHIENIDILNDTPLLDIKPYVPDFDSAVDIRTGWLEQARKTVAKRKSDSRFK
jgi:tRNA (adenine37-N6)-methyltransferase